MFIKIALLSLTLLFTQASAAREVRAIDAGEGISIDVRTFPAEGNNLLLGFPCDEGSSIAEEATATSLAQDGVEVWMPDMLSAYMLPKVRSSISEIPTEAAERLIEEAVKTEKNVYLIASGPDTDLTLRAAAQWEEKHPEQPPLAGIVLLFPRLNKGQPEPGKAPEYVEPVGKTRLPLLILEGERTPNRWAINHLKQALEKGGSPVHAKLIPDVRGYFFKRADPNMPEEVATAQLSGMIKASLYYLEHAQ